MERRLGRGLGSLLSKPEATEEGPVDVDLRSIRPNPHQPRKAFDAGALEELKSSISTHGVLQPVVVRPAEEGYELIAGERRWRAARLAGLQRIAAVVRTDVSDEQMLELALIENVQRANLDPIEKARGFQALMETLSLTQEAVATKVGLKRSTVTNHLRLLDLPQEAQDAVSQELITMGHARALLGLQDRKILRRLLAEIGRQDLSVREVERRVREAQGREAARSRSGGTPPQPWAREMERRLRERLGTKVAVHCGPDYRGQILIEFFGREDLERLYGVLAPSPTVDAIPERRSR